MSTQEPIDWRLYRSFLAVMRHGSLSGAARQLGMTQPSIGRHMDALEQALGVALFTRMQHGLIPTPLAAELLSSAEAMEAAVKQASRVASGGAQEEGGTVRLTVSQMMGGEVLPALLADYRRQHPRVNIELVLSNKSEDLLRREADIAVRMVKPTQQSLIAKRLGRVDIGIYAHRDYVKQFGMPRSVMELAQHSIIGPDQDTTVSMLLQQRGLELSRDMFALRTDNDLAQMAALRAGFGIGGCQVGMAKQDPTLLPVLAEQLTFSLDMWLLTHDSLRTNKRVMALFKYLTEKLTAYAKQSQR
jgi:DNA-binding transcriptional LysR family regulator